MSSTETFDYEAIINPDVPGVLINNLKKASIKSHYIPKTPLVAKPLAGHADLQVFIHNKNCFLHHNIEYSFINEIEYNVHIQLCDEMLQQEYPHDIYFNIAYVNKKAIHKTDKTAKKIADYFNRHNITPIDVPQGYSKCSTVIINDEAIISADKKITEKARGAGISGLHIQPAHVSLHGYAYGFLGGATGAVNNQIYFTGTINHHPDYKRIMEFLEEHNCEAVFLTNYPVFDIGSIIIY